MPNRTLILGSKALLLAGVLAGSILPLSAPAQATAPTPSAAAQTSAAKPAAGAQSPVETNGAPRVGAPLSRRLKMSSRSAEMYYGLIWGVDSLKVKYAESGEIIRFSYRVLDTEKAKTLNDKKNEPSLIDPKAGVKLVVPSMEKVGKLRQSSTPQAGKMYWMAFSNKGRLVKPGDHVIVVIGNFQANGLIVE